MPTSSHRPSRLGRRARLIGATATTLGLVTAFQAADIAAALDGEDTGPVTTESGVAGLLEAALGDSIVTDKTSIKARDGKNYWLENHLDADAIPTDVLGDLGLGDALVDLGLGGSDAGGSVEDDGIPPRVPRGLGRRQQRPRQERRRAHHAPQDHRPGPDRPEGADRSRLLRGRRRDQGLPDLRQGGEHRDGRAPRRERAPPHAVHLAQGQQHLRRRPLHRRHRTSWTPPSCPS